MPDRKSGSNRYKTTADMSRMLEIRDQQRRDFNRAQVLAAKIVALIGAPAYNAWLDDIYGDRETIGWRALGDMMQARIDELNSAECDHVLPEQTCALCAPKLPADEIPYAKDML